MTFEWLPISLPEKFQVVDQKDFGIAANEIEVSRGSDLWLRVSASGAGRCSELKPGTAGTEFRASPIKLLTRGNQPCVLDGYRRTNGTTTGETRSQIEGLATALSVTLRAGEPSYIVEWLTNAPDVTWPGLTERTAGSNPMRKRFDSAIAALQRVGGTIEEVGEGFSSHFDYVDLHLMLPTVETVRIGTVPAAFTTEGMSIERPGFLEYHPGPGGLPNDQIRNTVRRAFEFLFGGGLGLLGHSEVDQDGQAIRAVTRSTSVPGGPGPALRPALLHEDLLDGLDEALVASLVRRYVELEPIYGLNGAVWRYLYSRRAPLEMKAGYVGAAFEILRRGFYARPENESRSSWLPSDQWTELAKSLDMAIDTLAKSESWETWRDPLNEIRARMSGLNSVPGGRLNRQLLRDLALQSGKTEKRALQARNDAAHANEVDPAENFARLRDYRAAHTLFARVMFAILGIPVHYFDYSTEGFPPRELKDAQGAG